MEKLRERLRGIRKQDVLLWTIVVAALFLTLHWAPPGERWERARRILLLSVLTCWFSRSRKKP